MSNLSRAVRQLLQDLQSAGLTHVPKGIPPEAAERPLPVASIGASGAGRSVPAESRRKPLTTAPAVEKTTLFEAPVPGVVSAPNVSPSTDSLSVRQEKLNRLAECVAGCLRCPHLARTRTQTVFGVGNPKARILFIGEAPGADEDRTGIPFVGKAGQLMDKIIDACGWKREDLYICNILRCRPPENRTPTEVEAANCREYLDGQIATVDPDYIVCWGSCAAQNLLGSKEPIGKMRQRMFQYGRARVLCTYHPSYLLRNPAAKKPVWDDMKFLMAEMGHVPPAR